MAGPAQRLRDPVSGVMLSPRMRAAEPGTTELWGPPPPVESETLRRLVAELQADLNGLVDDIRRGPLARLLADGHLFLGDVRRAFLRHHRRLVVHIRAEGGTEFAARVRGELAELADAFRVHTLSRASRSSHEAWSPSELSRAIDQVLADLPVTVTVPVEPATYRRSAGMGVLGKIRLGLLRADRWLRRISGDEPPQREIEVRGFFGWHIYQAEMDGLEGLAVLLVQADAHLESRARSLFSLIVETLEALIAEPSDLSESLGSLRAQVEEELVLAEQELQQFLNDVERRSRQLLSGALRSAKSELVHVGTYRLPSRRRRARRLVFERDRFDGQLVARLDACRKVAGGGYVLFGLQLEVAAFRVRAKQVLETEFMDLERGVRGRSLKQIERIRAELDLAVADLGGPEGRSSDGAVAESSAEDEAEAKRTSDLPSSPVEPLRASRAEGAEGLSDARIEHSEGVRFPRVDGRGGPRPSEATWPDFVGPGAAVAGEKKRAGAIPSSESGIPLDTAELEKRLENLRRVLRDAQRSAQQLVDQLTTEQALSGPLEEVAREARALTDYYRVPVARLPHAEWTLPQPAELVELPLATIVATFVETDIAPELLGTAASAAPNLQPMLVAFAEVERVVNLGGGQLDGDDALVRDTPERETREVLRSAFEQARDLLQALEGPADGWARGLAGDLRRAARSRLEALQSRMDEGGLETTAEEARLTQDSGGRSFWSELERLGEALLGLGAKSTRTVREAVGEDRLADVRKVLGLPRARGPEEESDPFGPPSERTTVPPFYRRLFAGQATWAGDVLEECDGALRMARQAFSGSPSRGLRTAVIVGTEGSGRRALTGALTRGDRFGSVRRVAFTEPTSAARVREVIGDGSNGQLVVITGFSQLVSATPGGFDGVRALSEVVLADGGRNAFLLEADRLVWRWSCAAAPLGEVFATTIEARSLSPDELEAALLARHRLSGLELVIDSPESDEVARRRLFRELHRASDGLLQIALAFWLATLLRFDEGQERVIVGAVPPSPHEAMRRLPESTLHVLYLVARQGWMSREVLGPLLGRRQTEAEALLVSMVRMGLLERTALGLYQVRRHLGGPLMSILEERGWLSP